MRHAWLIIAHNEFDILQRLVSMLDDARSDFFVHIDAKVHELPALKVERGRLFMMENRVDVRWGSVSQIEVELALMETALQHGPYDHYHILSGTHLMFSLSPARNTTWPSTLRKGLSNMTISLS